MNEERDWLTVDSSARTHIVACALCACSYGPWTSYKEALKFKRSHRPLHAEECTHPGCSSPVLATGLCARHYRAEERRKKATR